jgi:hypothetical protein
MPTIVEDMPVGNGSEALLPNVPASCSRSPTGRVTHGNSRKAQSLPPTSTTSIHRERQAYNLGGSSMINGLLHNLIKGLIFDGIAIDS